MSVGGSGSAANTFTFACAPRSLTISVTSTSAGAIHSPFCSGPNPAQMSRDRSSCRSRCHDSGSEKPISVQRSRSSVLTTPVRQTRCSPSLRMSTVRRVRPKYMRRPCRWRRSSPRFTIRVSVERVASAETPTRANTSMKLPENTQMSLP